MVASRTGTGSWKRLVLKVRTQAQREGLTNCPLCHTWLDYEHGREPQSAEVDHIIPHHRGGEDSIENVCIICRHCNQVRGGREAKALTARIRSEQLQPGTIW